MRTHSSSQMLAELDAHERAGRVSRHLGVETRGTHGFIISAGWSNRTSAFARAKRCSRINCRSVLGLISVFNVGPPVETDDGFVFFEADASSRERDISVCKRMQDLLHRPDCVHEWRDSIDDYAKAEIFKFGRPQ